MARHPNALLRFFKVLAGSSRDDLRRQVQFLKAENEILRSRIKKAIRTTPRERARLVRLGRPLGPAINRLITIVSPVTFARWLHGPDHKPNRRCPKPGRPKTPAEVRAVVLRIAHQTGFGYTRILGELRKLGIGNISRSTVINILREKGLPTGPQRGEVTWAEFLGRHAKTLWACDFLTTRVLTRKGLRFAFSLVFVHPRTRVAHVSASTTKPDAAWVERTVRRFVDSVPEGLARPELVARDRDKKFLAGKRMGRGFDAAMAAAEVAAFPLPHCSPNLNAHVERLIQSIQVECLDHFIVLGTRHLDHLLAEYVDYHNCQRPHSALGFATPMGRPPPAGAGPVEPLRLRCQERLGGVLKHYHWKAA